MESRQLKSNFIVFNRIHHILNFKHINVTVFPHIVICLLSFFITSTFTHANNNVPISNEVGFNKKQTMQTYSECPVDNRYKEHFYNKSTRQKLSVKKISPGYKDITSQCFLSLSDYLKNNSSRSLLVDIRNDQQYKNVHIPGSLNISAGKLIYQRNLKPKDIVLINGGYNASETTELCHKMNQTGFNNVSILEGGIRSWHAKGLKLQGLKTHKLSTSKISSQQFHSERELNNWIILATSKSQLDDIFETNQNTVIIEDHDQNSINLISNKFNQLIEHTSIKPKLIIFDNDEKTQIELFSIAIKITPQVYIMDGGFDGYKEYLSKQNIIWNYKPGNIGIMKCGQ